MSQTTLSLAADRISQLLDENSFVELGAYVTARNTDFNMAKQDTTSDGVLTGYGTINGSLVYVYSQDTAILGGSIGEMHAKKIADLYSKALKMGAPIIGLIDCAGLRLQEATDALDGFGKLYMSQALASGVIPQIQAIFGFSGGGMAISNTMCDFLFMESDKARIFVNSPNALSANAEDKCDTAAAKYQSEDVGNVDFIGNSGEIFAGIRELISILPASNEDDMSYEECRDDLNRLLPDIEAAAEDSKYALSMISDNNFIVEVKKDFGKEMFTGFIRLNGNTVGCIANRSKDFTDESISYPKELTHRGVDKAADFVRFCDAFSIPLLTWVDVEGYKATKCNEKRIARAASKLIYEFANATVAKVSIITGKAYGSAYLAMNSKSIGADMVYAWPNASIGMMDAKNAVEIMYSKEIAEADDVLSLIQEKTKEYQDLQSSALSAAKRGYVDDIIQPLDTRKRLIAAFEMLFTKREERPFKKHGTI